MMSKSIILIEDDPFIADIYLTKLREAGFEVEVVAGKGTFFQKLEEKKPDLILLDIVLPEINGWEILRKIKQNPELKDIKVVILSNLEQKAEIEKGLRLGAEKYLIKAHYTPSEVIEEVKKILEE